MFETCRRARDANALGVKRIDWNAHIPDEREVPATNNQEPPASLVGLSRRDDDWFLVKLKHAVQPPSTVFVEELIFRPDVFVVKAHGDRGAGDGPVYVNQGLKKDGKGKLPATAKTSGVLRRLELDAAGFFDLLFSDRWSEGCVLRVLKGQLLDDLLLALYRLATSHDVVSFATLVYMRDQRPLRPNIKNANNVLQAETQEILKQTVLVELDYFCPQQQRPIDSRVQLEISSNQIKTDDMLDMELPGEEEAKALQEGNDVEWPRAEEAKAPQEGNVSIAGSGIPEVEWPTEGEAKALQEGNLSIAGSVCNIRGQIRPPPHQDCYAPYHTIREPMYLRRRRECSVSPAIVPRAALPSQQQSPSDRKLEEKKKYDLADEIFLGVRDPEDVEMAASDPFLDLYDLPETLSKTNAQSHEEEKKKKEKTSQKKAESECSSICDDDEQPLFANFNLDREKQVQEDIRMMALEVITNTNLSPLERTQMSSRLNLALAAQRRTKKTISRERLSQFLPQIQIQKSFIMSQNMLANNMTAMSDITNKIKARNLPFIKDAQLPSELDKNALHVGKIYMQKPPSEICQMNMLSPKGSGKMHSKEPLDGKKIVKSTSVQFQALSNDTEVDKLNEPLENISLQQTKPGNRTPIKKEETQAKTVDRPVNEASLLKHWDKCPTFKEFSEYLKHQRSDSLMNSGKNKQAKGKATKKGQKNSGVVGKTFSSESKASKDESTSKKERSLTRKKKRLITSGGDDIEHNDASEDSEGISKKSLKSSKQSLTEKDGIKRSKGNNKQKPDNATRTLMSNEKTPKDKLMGKGKIINETVDKKTVSEPKSRQNVKKNANKELGSGVGKINIEKTGSDRKKSTEPLDLNSKARWFSAMLPESSESSTNVPHRDTMSAKNLPSSSLSNTHPGNSKSLPQFLSGLSKTESVHWLTRQVVKGMNSSNEKILTEEEEELLLLEDYIISEMDPWHISVRFAYLAGDLCNCVGVRNDLLRRRERIISTISRSKTKLKLNQNQMWVLIREIIRETKDPIRLGVDQRESTLSKIDENLDIDQIQRFSSTSVTSDAGCNFSLCDNINQTLNISTTNSAISSRPKTNKDSCNSAIGQESTTENSADDKYSENGVNKSNSKRKVSNSEKVKITEEGKIAFAPVQQSDEIQTTESNAITSQEPPPHSSESQMSLERSEIFEHEQSDPFDSWQQYYDEAELLVFPRPSELTLPNIVALRELRTRPTTSRSLTDVALRPGTASNVASHGEMAANARKADGTTDHKMLTKGASRHFDQEEAASHDRSQRDGSYKQPSGRTKGGRKQDATKTTYKDKEKSYKDIATKIQKQKSKKGETGSVQDKSKSKGRKDRFSQQYDDFDQTGKQGRKQKRDDFDQKAGKSLKGKDGLFPDTDSTGKSKKKPKGGKPYGKEGVECDEDVPLIFKGIFDTEKLKSSYSFEKMYAHRPNVLPNYKKLLAEFEKPFKGKKILKGKEKAAAEFDKPFKGKKILEGIEKTAAVADYLSKDESKMVVEPQESEANPPVVIGTLRRNYRFFQVPEGPEYIQRKPQPVQSAIKEMSFEGVCQLLTAATSLFVVRKERATTLFGTGQYDSRVTVTFTRRTAPDDSARDIVDYRVVAALCDTLLSH